MPKVGEIIKNLRKQKGMPQADLAMLSEVNQATISRIESGKMDNVGSDALAKIAAVFGVSTDYLFSRKKEIEVKVLIPKQEIEELIKYYQLLTFEMRESVLKIVKYAQKPFDEIEIEGWNMKAHTYRKPEKKKGKKTKGK